jgi:hypothetical protein
METFSGHRGADRFRFESVRKPILVNKANKLNLRHVQEISQNFLHRGVPLCSFGQCGSQAVHSGVNPNVAFFNSVQVFRDLGIPGYAFPGIAGLIVLFAKDFAAIIVKVQRG